MRDFAWNKLCLTTGLNPTTSQINVVFVLLMQTAFRPAREILIDYLIIRKMLSLHLTMYFVKITCDEQFHFYEFTGLWADIKVIIDLGRRIF